MELRQYISASCICDVKGAVKMTDDWHGTAVDGVSGSVELRLKKTMASVLVGKTFMLHVACYMYVMWYVVDTIMRGSIYL